MSATAARVWSYQSGRGEDEGSALELSAETSNVWYSRWTLKATYGYLETAEEHEAVEELESLRFSRYVDVESP